MDIFTVRDLRERTGALIRDAEEGKLALVTKRGHPVFLAVPFTEEMIEWGLKTAVAICLYKEGAITLPKAAKIAEQSIEGLMNKLSQLGVAIVNYSPSEIDQELSDFE